MGFKIYQTIPRWHQYEFYIKRRRIRLHYDTSSSIYQRESNITFTKDGKLKMNTDPVHNIINSGMCFRREEFSERDITSVIRNKHEI